MRKKKNNFESENKQKSIKLLVAMMDAANLIPYRVELGIDPLGYEEEWLHEAYQKLQPYPALVQYLEEKKQVGNEIVSDPITPENISDLSYAFDFYHRIKNFEETRELLKLLVGISDSYAEHLLMCRASSLPESIKWLPFFFGHSKRPNLRSVWEKINIPIDAKRFFELIVNTMRLAVDEEHQITFHLHGIIDLIKGLDLRRFKKCLVCEKFLWAFRLKTKFCSKHCASVHYQREIRKDPKKNKKINSQRRENYSYRDKNKGRRTKNNGTL